MTAQRPDAYTGKTLDERLKAYIAALQAAGLSLKAVDAYSRRASRFLRWRAASTHNDKASTLERLTAQLDEFEASLADKAPLTISTYVDGADRFLSWIAGEYRPRGPRAASPAADSRPAAATRPIEDDVIDAVAAYLKSERWKIVSTRSAAGHEHGVDIEARLGERRLLVEAKGWPSARYVAGERKGELKRYLPYTQGRAYFSNALLPVLLSWSEHNAEVALAFPDQLTYKTLVDRCARALRHLGIGVYFVAIKDGRPGDVLLRLEHRERPAG